MASFGAFHLLLIATIANEISSEQSFVTLQCKSESVVELGHPGLLECSVQLSAEASNANIRILTWKRKGERNPVVRSIRGPLEVEPGYSLADQQWDKTLNVSLLITTATVAHDGQYTCYVQTDSGESEASINLRVTARYSHPVVYSIPEKIVANAANTLVCEAAGGYPQGDLRWHDTAQKDWTKSSKMEAKKMENGCFNLTSKLVVPSGSTFYEFTCVVFNATRIKEAEATFVPQEYIGGPEPTKSAPNLTNIVAPAVVIGSLIVGLLLTLLLCRRKRAQYPDDHHQVPQEERNVEEGDCQNLKECRHTTA